MANVAELVLRIVGKDATEGAFSAVSTGLDGVEKKAKGTSSRLNETAEAGGNAEQALRGVSDISNFLGESMGVNVGPVGAYGAALADLGGGAEALLKGGPELVKQIGSFATSLGPAIAATWAHVAALTAQAAAFIAANAPILLVVAGIALVTAGVVLAIKHWDDLVAIYHDKVVPAFRAVREDGMEYVMDFLRNNWPEVLALVTLPFTGAFVALATDAFGIRSGMLRGLGEVLDFVGDWAGKAGTFFTNLTDGPVQWLIDRVWQLIHAIQSIPSLGDIGGGVTGKVSGGLRSIPVPGNPFRAEGGPVLSGRAYIVGERGPEWFVPGQSGSVLPNGGGPGGEPAVNFYGPLTVNNHGATKDAQGTMKDVAFSIAAELRSRGMWVPA